MSEFLLGNFSASVWSARKYDRKASAKTNAHYNAQVNAARVNKKLTPANSTLEVINAQVRTTRAYFKSKTVQYDETDRRALPNCLFQEVATRIEDDRVSWQTNVDQYCASEYAHDVREAQTLLGGLFRADDYPISVRDKFSWKFFVEAEAQTLNGTLLHVEAQIAEQLRQQIADENTARMQRGIDDLSGRVRECCQRFIDNLGKDKPRLFDTMIQEARDLSESIPQLNIANDARLSAIGNLVGELATYPIDTLRTSQQARDAILSKARALVAQV